MLRRIHESTCGLALMLCAAALLGCGSAAMEEPEPEPEPEPMPAPNTEGIARDATIDTVSISSTGDNVTSASVELVDDGEDQDFLVTLAPVVDPVTNRPYGASDADRFAVASAARGSTGSIATTLTVKGGAADGTVCDAELDFGEGTASGADVAFLVDTTGSMGRAVTGIADSIEAFAQELDAAGLGVRFAFVTFGDAYDTKRTEFSGYTLGTGTDEPTRPDPTERPLLDFTSDVELFSDFVEEVRNNVGGGAGGGDGPENYYGVASAMNAKASDALGTAGSPLSRRIEVPYYQVLVGDNCAHTEELPGSTFDSPWLPPSSSALPTVLGDGSVTVHSVLRESFNPLWCLEGQLTLTDLSDATGGANLSFPSSGEVDLSALDLAAFITNFWLVRIDSECVSKASDAVQLELELTVDDGDTERTQSFTFDMTFR
ncbi:MAG: vWA domain-containing protein [Myxococcota bacterium]